MVGWFTLVIAATAITCGRQQPVRLISFNAARIAAVKASFDAGRRDDEAAVHKLLRDAEKGLKQKPLSVTAKPQVPPSGDKHDYMSLASYWWPDPKSQNGLPYIRKDGAVNPERDSYTDRENFGHMNSAVTALALGYYVSDKEPYARHAARLLSVWYLDSTTRMNPNLNFSQAVKGRNQGRGAGLIEMHTLPRILDAVLLLRGSKSWTPAKDLAFVEWCRKYHEWLTASPIGLAEQKASNNHGTWYDVQRTSLALFLGNSAEARMVLEEAKQLRIMQQIEPDGRQPKELVRTKALGYSTFNLLAMTTLATIGRNAGVDLWHFESSDGRSIRKAIDWMMPYYRGSKPWEYQQIAEWKPDEAVVMLTIAGLSLDGPYAETAAKISKDESMLLRARMMY